MANGSNLVKKQILICAGIGVLCLITGAVLHRYVAIPLMGEEIVDKPEEKASQSTPASKARAKA
ncbi:MAG: hypothetical protein WBA74_03675 [Cyclobacteriaceae bacterium]